MNSWIPISSGKYPPLMQDVQVSYYRDTPFGCKMSCDRFAYVVFDEIADSIRWEWSYSEEPTGTRIIAWRYNDDAYDPNKKTAQNGYDSTVRRCMSDEYVRVSKELQSVKLKYSEVYEQLQDKSIPHSEYIDKENYIKVLGNDIKRLEVELNTWDAAREICLNVADGGS